MDSLKRKELLSLRIPPELNRQLANHVKPMGLSKNAFILGLVNRELEQSTGATDTARKP